MQEIVYHTNYKLEDTYWWFVARNKILAELIARYTDLNENDTVLDVGCGTGGFASFISKWYRVLCLDTSEIALDYCKQRGLQNLFNTTLDSFPKSNYSLKALFMLDVVEHIDDDKGLIAQAFELLSNNGYIIATVPAYKWLWSKHDEIHHHKRRYTKNEFNDMLKNQGFEIVFSSYFNTLLFLPAVIKRFLNKFKKAREDESPVDEVSDSLNKIFEKIFAYEKGILRHCRMPFGLSLITIAKKLNVT